MSPLPKSLMFQQRSQSFLLLHTNPADAQPLAVSSVQHAHDLNVFGGLNAKANEFAFLYHYLFEYMGPMIVCGVDNVGLALDRFGDTINDFIAISQLSDDQIINCVAALDKRRTGVLHLLHQKPPAAPLVEYRELNL